MRRAGAVVAVVAALAVAGCGGGGDDGGGGLAPACDLDLAVATPGSRAASLVAVDDWLYQLQGPGGGPLDLGAIAATDYDLAVVDYSRDGSAEGEFSAAEVAALRAGGRVALAYLSIAEAEDGRFYFDGLPADLIVGANPAFPDDFTVFFCDARWQDVIIGPDHAPGAATGSYLDRILAAGFDGAYLDIIEAYASFRPGCAAYCADGCDGDDAAEDMASFVEAIARHAREVHGKPDFLVVPQNGAEIVDALADGGAAYLAAVDGIGSEDTFYFDESDTLAVDAPLSPQCDQVMPALDRFVAAGKVVLAVDYLTMPGLIDDFYGRAERRHYLPFAAATRDLDQLTLVSGHLPD